MEVFVFWLVMNKSSVSRTQWSTYSQILYCVLERWTRTHNQIMQGKTDWRGSRVHHKQNFGRNWGEPVEFEWNIFPGFTTLQLCNKVQELLSRLSVEPEKFTGRIIFVSMINDISWWSKDIEKECDQLLNSFLYMQRDSEQDNGHSSWLVVNTLFQEVTDHHHQEDGSRETQKLGPFWKLQPVAYKVNMEWKSE